jgi:hypothetical protein
MTPVTLRARRRLRIRARWGMLTAAIGLVTGSAVEAAKAVDDRALTCFVAPQGGPLRVGDPVRDRYGREIGSVSAEQCAPDADPARLRVAPNLYGADLLEIAARDVEGDDPRGGVRLALSAEQLQERTWLARAPGPRRQG